MYRRTKNLIKNCTIFTHLFFPFLWKIGLFFKISHSMHRHQNDKNEMTIFYLNIIYTPPSHMGKG